MVMIGDIATFFQGIVTLVRCSRRSRNSPDDLGSMVDSNTSTGSKPAEMETALHQDISNLSTDGSHDGGSPDVSDSESTTESTEANSEGKSDILDEQILVPAEGQIAKESCLNKWAQPFVPAEPALVLPNVLRSPIVELPSEADVHANLAHVISRLSPTDAATVSAFLELKLAKAGKTATDPSLKEAPLVDHGCHSQCGFKPPPGLCQHPPIKNEYLREPLRPGLVESSAKHARGSASKSHAASDVQDNNLRSNLDKLSQFDPACIFLVRKINRLGLNSADFLKAYFSTFGTVECVLASHSIEKPTPARPKPRVRPAGLAFVVMEKPDDVTSILGSGAEHVVQGVKICASTYEHNKRYPGASEE